MGTTTRYTQQARKVMGSATCTLMGLCNCGCVVLSHSSAAMAAPMLSHSTKERQLIREMMSAPSMHRDRKHCGGKERG